MTAPDPRELLKGTTPGPWKLVQRNEYHPPVLGTYDVVGANGYGISGIGVEEGTESTDTANARLIAAAPDLARRLAEAEELLREIVRRNNDNSTAKEGPMLHKEIVERSRAVLLLGEK